MNNWMIIFITLGIAFLLLVAYYSKNQNLNAAPCILFSFVFIALTLVGAVKVYNRKNTCDDIVMLNYIYQGETIRDLAKNDPELGMKLMRYNDFIIENKESYIKYGRWSWSYGTNILKCKTFK